MINILFVLPNFDTGGSEKLVIDIIKNIDKKRFSPVLCVFYSGCYENEFLKLGVPFYKIHDNTVTSKINTIKMLNNIVRKHQIQVINTHHPATLIQGFFPYRIMNSIPLWVHTEHTRLDMHPHLTGKIIFAEKMCLKSVNVALGISQGICDFFEHNLDVSRKKIKKILNGVDVARFDFDIERAKTSRKLYREKLHINDEDLVIGLFANFREQKNHQCLVRAAAILKNKGINNFKVVFAGSGPLEQPNRELADQLGISDNVLFLGPRMDIPELMNMIDIYCLPSFFEGLPLSMMEAMAAKKVVVASDVMGNNEIAIHNRNALLVKSNSSEDLSSALTEVMINKNLRETLAKNAREDIDKHSFAHMIKEYETLFGGI